MEAAGSPAGQQVIFGHQQIATAISLVLMDAAERLGLGSAATEAAYCHDLLHRVSASVLRAGLAALCCRK